MADPTPIRRTTTAGTSATGLANPRTDGEGEYSFLCTGDAEAFRTLGTRFLQLPLAAVEPLTLEGTHALATGGPR